MPEILLLTGNCGVGKTTVANAWAEVRNGAAVHGDDVRHWVRDFDTRRANDYQQDLIATVAIVAARSLLEQGLSVAIENVWTPPALDRLRSTLMPLAPTRVVRLICDRATNRARDAGRPVGRMGERVDVLGDLLDAIAWPAWVRVVASTGVTVAETLNRIDHVG